MSYYWFDRKDLLKRPHDKYHKESGKERAADYYETNKEKIKKTNKETSIKICQKKKKRK